MYELNVYYNQGLGGLAATEKDFTVALTKSSVALFRRHLLKGQGGRLWARLPGRSRSLWALTALLTRVRNRTYVGLRTVPLSQICGSEGREGDFDADFNPLQERDQQRWVRVAVAWQAGEPLPPVELIQVGDRYFVRDGHHRISVARALGQESIEAEVAVWEVAGPWPWETPVAPRRQAVAPLA